MQSNKKILTITIPTYNRAEKLQKQIRLLLPQLTEEVVILVLDNNSPYDIRELFTENENKKITVLVNKVNIGMSTNYIRCLEYAETKWVWTLSDDDPVMPNAVLSILNIIKKEPNAISVCMNMPFDIVSNDFEEFTELLRNQKIFSMHFWMSICLYNLDILRPFLYWGCNYSTTMIAPLLVVLKCLEDRQQGSCILKSIKIIESAENTTSWKKTDFLICLSLVYDIFRTRRRQLKKTFFYGITNLYLLLLIKGISERSISKQETIYILKILFSKTNCIYIMKYFPIIYLKICIYLIFPISSIDKIKKIKKYNLHKEE